MIVVIVVHLDTDTLDRGITERIPFIECAIHIFNCKGLLECEGLVYVCGESWSMIIPQLHYQ